MGKYKWLMGDPSRRSLVFILDTGSPYQNKACASWRRNRCTRSLDRLREKFCSLAEIRDQIFDDFLRVHDGYSSGSRIIVARQLDGPAR